MSGSDEEKDSPLQDMEEDDDADATCASGSGDENTDPEEEQRPKKRLFSAPKLVQTAGRGVGQGRGVPALRGKGRGRGAPAGNVLALKPAVVSNPAPRLRLSSGNIKAPFKMPVPNYKPNPDKPKMTIGLARNYLGFNQLLSTITRHIADPEATAQAPEGDATPFMIYDPSQDQDEGRRAKGLKPVYVEAGMAAKLRPHQREGVAFMFRCLAGLQGAGNFTGAILMDGMGLGKTFQSICTLWTLLTTGTEGQPTCKRALIICPSSLVMNWGNELQRWIGPGRVEALVMDDTRGAKVKEALASAWGGGKGLMASLTGGRFYGKPQVLIMSYTTFRMHKDIVYNKRVDLVVCDEAHGLKNVDSQTTQAVANLPATRRLLLSGTPVQNDLLEFYSLFHVAVPGLLGEKHLFKKQYETPISRGQDADATEREQRLSSERQAELLQKCGPYMLRRTCGVMAQYLPPKVEQVVFCKMSPLQVKLYNHFYKSDPVQRMLRGGRANERAEFAAATAATKAPRKPSGHASEPIEIDADDTEGVAEVLMALGGENQQAATQSGRASGAAAGRASGKGGGGKRKSGASAAAVAKAGADAPRGPELTVLAAITAVKKLCCHPDLIYKMVTGSSGPPNPMAGRLSGGAMAAAGGPASGCAASSSKGAAAAVAAAAEGGPKDVLTGFEGCGGLFNDAQLQPRFVPGKLEVLHSGKIYVLMNLLKSIRTLEPTDKVVLVSNYTECLDLLEKLAAGQGWQFLRLDGSLDCKKRQPLVDTFNDPAHPSVLFLLSSKAGGVGLNIIGANRLVLVDPDWNPANDLQAMARVWREGQKKHVWIYRLLTTGTLEEKIYQRQLMKQGLSKSVVDDSKDQGQFSTEELRALFKLNPNVLCDTHEAIKCTCDGSNSTMVSKAKALVAAKAAEEQAAADQADKVDDEAGVMEWAHLLDVEHSPDAVWKDVPLMVRKRFVSYLFSNHITNLPKKPAVTAVEEEEEEEEEEEQQGKGSAYDDDD